MQYFAACLPKLHPQAWHSFYSVVTRIAFVGETGVILGTAEKIWPKVCRKGREGRRSVHGCNRFVAIWPEQDKARFASSPAPLTLACHGRIFVCRNEAPRRGVSFPHTNIRP